jgi:pimeloyl-ACP methyl ester carboxylesterase
MDKTGALLRWPYDWSKEVSRLSMPVMIVMSDHDSMPPSEASAFFSLVGGLPGRTHYDAWDAPEVVGQIADFLDA